MEVSLPQILVPLFTREGMAGLVYPITEPFSRQPRVAQNVAKTCFFFECGVDTMSCVLTCHVLGSLSCVPSPVYFTSFLSVSPAITHLSLVTCHLCLYISLSLS